MCSQIVQPDKVTVSLIVCTKNRAMRLDRCLAAIAAIETPQDIGFEFLLVDNGSTDSTRAVYERRKRTMAFPTRYLLDATPGIGNAMNCGYRASAGSIVAFTDDDCYPAPDFAATVAAAFADLRVGVVAGRILLHDPADLPITIEESREPRRFPAGAYVRPGQFHGANLCFRRDALDQVGGFDPLFGPGSYIGSAADCDAAARVCLAGWDGLYEPSIVVRHHHGRRPVHLPGLRKRYGIGSGGYHMKLLVHEGQWRHFLRFLRGAVKRVVQDPPSVFWEAVGAERYLKRPAAQRREARRSRRESTTGRDVSRDDTRRSRSTRVGRR